MADVQALAGQQQAAGRPVNMERTNPLFVAHENGDVAGLLVRDITDHENETKLRRESSSQATSSGHSFVTGNPAAADSTVTLSWESLSFTVKPKRQPMFEILKGLTGIARSGRVLSILGKSGAGKTTLVIPWSASPFALVALGTSAPSVADQSIRDRVAHRSAALQSRSAEELESL